MLLNTAPYGLEAHFFMKDEPVKYDDTLPVIAPSQVHGSEIVHVNDENFAGIARPEADGVLLTTTRASASLRFADCAPVMMWGKGWVMILHSGYKGTVLNISGHGLGLVRGLFGDEAVSSANAWVGPCIGYKHYCRDIADEWTQKGMHSFHAANFEERDGKIYFDLAGEIHSQLLDCGVSEERITLTGIDTFTDLRCYSYRRGDKKERMTLYAKLL
ncbi:MAG: polyphenol oxidase family protein [Synergistaceae bacterium]|nr:polyphenol oxidase family protein [Synergistaceae bacterium]